MIRFVTALRSEATPLIERWHLKPRTGAFPWFASNEAAPDVALVVSGVGKRAASAATAFLHARTGETPDAIWLNVGIAGHATRAPGDVLLAHTIVDAGSRERWYPPRVGVGSALALHPATVVSVDTPEVEFESDAAYDMEAAGFYPIAARFQTTELVQVVKVTSDNRERSFTRLTRADVTGLMEATVEPLAGLLSCLERLRAELPRWDAETEEELSRFVEKWRFSASEARKLDRLLVRWRAVAPRAIRSPGDFAEARSSSEVLASLQRRLSRLSREHPV